MGLRSYRSLAHTGRGCELRLSYGANSLSRWHASQSPIHGPCKQQNKIWRLRPIYRVGQVSILLCHVITCPSRFWIVISLCSCLILTHDNNVMRISFALSIAFISNRSPLISRSEVVNSLSKSIYSLSPSSSLTSMTRQNFTNLHGQ